MLRPRDPGSRDAAGTRSARAHGSPGRRAARVPRAIIMRAANLRTCDRSANTRCDAEAIELIEFFGQGNENHVWSLDAQTGRPSTTPYANFAEISDEHVSRQRAGADRWLRQ